MNTVDVKFFTSGDPFVTGAAAQKTTDRNYSYYITAQQAKDLEAGKHELAVVQAPGDDGGYKVVKIVGSPSMRPASAEKHIISLVSLTEYKANLAKAGDIRKLRAKIEQRANEIAEEARLAALASNDTAMAALLEQLRSLES